MHFHTLCRDDLHSIRAQHALGIHRHKGIRNVNFRCSDAGHTLRHGNGICRIHTGNAVKIHRKPITGENSLRAVGNMYHTVCVLGNLRTVGHDNNIFRKLVGIFVRFINDRFLQDSRRILDHDFDLCLGDIGLRLEATLRKDKPTPVQCHLGTGRIRAICRIREDILHILTKLVT